MAAKTTPTLETLGAKIAELSKALSAQLKAANHPQPSFAADGSDALPTTPDVQGPRMQLIEAALDLVHLATGPSEYILQE
ncbi:hypothetical protein HK405_000491, partial [Cladochytrium tenue]